MTIWWRQTESLWRDGLASSNLKMTIYDGFMTMTTTMPHVILNIKWQWRWRPMTPHDANKTRGIFRGFNARSMLKVPETAIKRLIVEGELNSLFLSVTTMFWDDLMSILDVLTLSLFLRPILTVTSAWNTGETGDIYWFYKVFHNFHKKFIIVRSYACLIFTFRKNCFLKVKHITGDPKTKFLRLFLSAVRPSVRP